MDLLSYTAKAFCCYSTGITLVSHSLWLLANYITVEKKNNPNFNIFCSYVGPMKTFCRQGRTDSSSDPA